VRAKQAYLHSKVVLNPFSKLTVVYWRAVKQSRHKRSAMQNSLQGLQQLPLPQQVHAASTHMLE
jgi:hypothetical protein